MSWEILYHLPFILITAALTQPVLKKLIGNRVGGWLYYLILVIVSLAIYAGIIKILLLIFFHDTIGN
ncbi:hypothetical protein LX99_01285 [Mucilaginibacter oryzae]|uniref:Uncharacterized protein n=1 Tax=Mucilaginibacter oryzae TaxID=468058 RepID=A0A316HV63_9SPHI|nr:hypothetical protein [Mucilaginibacter oryzae]PWK78832.1 hypothetical protein LX99_01285 [Mucilaginibacter oryzae]